MRISAGQDERELPGALFKHGAHVGNGLLAGGGLCLVPGKGLGSVEARLEHPACHRLICGKESRKRGVCVYTTPFRLNTETSIPNLKPDAAFCYSYRE